MKPSEMMRAGNQYPQTTKIYIKYDDDGNVCGTCALGSILLGSSDKIVILDPYADFFTTIGLHELHTHPVSGRQMPYYDIIANLNDDHHWTIEQIAQWLEDEGC